MFWFSSENPKNIPAGASRLHIWIVRVSHNTVLRVDLLDSNTKANYYKHTGWLSMIQHFQWSIQMTGMFNVVSLLTVLLTSKSIWCAVLWRFLSDGQTPNEGQFLAVALCRHCISFGPDMHSFGFKPRTSMSTIQYDYSTVQVRVQYSTVWVQYSTTAVQYDYSTVLILCIIQQGRKKLKD